MIKFDRRGFAVMIAGFCTFLNVYTPQAILPALAKTFDVPLPRTGLTITAPLLAVAFVAPFVGTISDRLGRKWIILSAAAILVAPILLVARAASLDEMVFWRFVQGLLFPFIFAVTIAYVGDECEGAEAIRTAGFYTSGTIAGGFGGRFLAGIASDFFGWRFAFVLLAAITAMCVGAIAAFLPVEQKFVAFRGGARATLGTYGEHLRNPRLLATCCIGAGMLFAMVTIFTYVNFYLAAPPFGLNSAELGFVFAVYLLGFVTTPLASRLAVRSGRRFTIALAIAIAGAGSLLTLVPRIGAVIAGMALVAAGMFVVQSLSLGFIGVIARRAKSTAVGLFVTVYYLGGSLGGVVAAPFWRWFGWPGVIALLFGVMALMLATALRFWREPRLFGAVKGP